MRSEPWRPSALPRGRPRGAGPPVPNFPLAASPYSRRRGSQCSRPPLGSVSPCMSTHKQHRHSVLIIRCMYPFTGSGGGAGLQPRPICSKPAARSSRRLAWFASSPASSAHKMCCTRSVAVQSLNCALSDARKPVGRLLRVSVLPTCSAPQPASPLRPTCLM